MLSEAVARCKPAVVLRSQERCPVEMIGVYRLTMSNVPSLSDDYHDPAVTPSRLPRLTQTPDSPDIRQIGGFSDAASRSPPLGVAVAAA